MTENRISAGLLHNMDYTYYYNDGEILVSRDIRELSSCFDYLNKIPVVTDQGALLIGRNGKLQVSINNREYAIHPNEVIAIPPYIPLSDIMMSTDFVCDVISMKRSMIYDMFMQMPNVAQAMPYLFANPVFKLNEKHQEYLYQLYELIYNAIKEKVYEHHQLVMKSLINAFISVLADIIYSQIDVSVTSVNKNLHGDEIVRKFLLMQEYEQGKMRNVNKYAEQLNVTSKYLAVLVKKQTGKTPIEIITATAVQNISNELRFTQKSVKEIAAAFHFENLSFFGKYVKKHLGMSLLAYRKKNK